MSEPRKFSSLLSRPGSVEAISPGCPHHCSRCLRLAPEYTKHDPSWTPPDAASYVKEGVVYWLGNCESCNQLEFDAKLLKRLGAVGSPNESGLTERERERREAETAKLHRERAMYAEGRKAREERYAMTSGGVPHDHLSSRAPSASPEETAPDYAMLRAEPGTDFAEWWERQ